MCVIHMPKRIEMKRKTIDNFWTPVHQDTKTRLVAITIIRFAPYLFEGGLARKPTKIEICRTDNEKWILWRWVIRTNDIYTTIYIINNNHGFALVLCHQNPSIRPLHLQILKSKRLIAFFLKGTNLNNKWRSSINNVLRNLRQRAPFNGHDFKWWAQSQFER